jgi:uncharacterized protein
VKTPIVVVDTNVFVSGIFFSGPPYRILKAWQDDRIQIAVTEEIIEEYRRVIETLSGKFESNDIDYFWELLLIDVVLQTELDGNNRI